MKAPLLILLTLLTAQMSHAQDSVSVLFIGNSYTYVNDLPNTTRLLAGSLGKELTVGSKTNGGFTLGNHSFDPQTYTAIHQNNWDVVILQEQSQMPSFDDDQVNSQTIPYARKLADSVYSFNSCSNLMLYMTWGRENGDPQWEPISTFNGMNQRLYNAYMRMADSTEAMVSPVGAVWKYVRDNYPSIQLYSGDGSHPSVAGTYLAAATFYTALFREPATGASYTSGLDAQTAQQLINSVNVVMLDSLDHFKLHRIDQPVHADFVWVQDDDQIVFESISTREDEWNWYFGDGNFSTGENPVHSYISAGNYEVTLVVSNECASDTVTKNIIVATVGIDELSDYQLKEFSDRFELFGESMLEKAEFYDIDGRLVKSSLNPGKNILKIIGNGIAVFYFEDGKVIKKRFVKS